jgi:hypothetical protein
MRNLYSFLNINETATPGEIASAFEAHKKELMKFSPGIEIDNIQLRNRQPEIWDAYHILLDPATKKKHDEHLERDRAHELYESKSKLAESEGQRRSSERAGFIGIVILVVVLSFYFIFTGSDKDVFEQANWKKHHITNEVSVMLPSKIDTTINILPPFLQHYIEKGSCYRSGLRDGFSVTVAQFEMNPRYVISQKDVSYIVNVEMSSHMTILQPDSVNYTMNLHGYNMFVRKGTYSIDGALRAFENYSMVNGTSAIKVIISYIPGNELHMKYAEIVFKSLMI